MKTNCSEKVGKKVWLYNKTGQISYTLDKSKIWEVVSYIPYDSGTVKNGDEIKTVDYFEIVFIPDGSEFELYHYLNDNRMYAEIYSNKDEETIIGISWGDWKHDHGYLVELMKHIGYEEYDEIVTEEDGSDCYSSEHYFRKTSAVGVAE